VTPQDLRTTLASIQELPALPTLVTEINALLSNPKTTAPELSKLVSRDPALTAKLLKIANSSFFGLPKRLDSVNQSIIVLGFNTVRSIVLCSSVLDVFSKSKSKAKSLSQKDFWAFSVGVAAASRVVARNAGEQKTETFFVTGLLHGVGKMVLDRFLSDHFDLAMRRSIEKGIPLWQAERETLGVSNAQAGGIMLDLWKLSRDMSAAVEFQEDPSSAPENFRKGSAYILVGNVLARVLSLGDCGETIVPRITESSLALAGITPEQWPRLMELTVDEAQRAAVFMDMS